MILDFRGLDSGRALILWGGIPRPIGDYPESLRLAILVEIILVGRLGARTWQVYDAAFEQKLSARRDTITAEDTSNSTRICQGKQLHTINFHRQLKCRWKMPLTIHWEMPLKIRDDF